MCCNRGIEATPYVAAALPRFRLFQKEEMMKRVLPTAAILVIVASTPALAVPDCWGVIAQKGSGEKVARITCSDDGAPGTAGSYTCSFTWNVRGASGFTEQSKGQFVSSRGDKNIVKYENGNLSDGSKLDDAVDGISMSCAAK